MTLNNINVTISTMKPGEENAVKIDGFTVVKFIKVTTEDIDLFDQRTHLKIFDKEGKRVGFASIFKRVDFSNRGMGFNSVRIVEDHEIFDKIGL